MLTSNSLHILLLAAKNPTGLLLSKVAEQVGVREEAIVMAIKELEHEDYLQSKKLIEGIQLSLTPRGRLALSNIKGDISLALGDRSVLQGVVRRGKGEGKYCVSTDGYKKPLAQLLGGDPYEGTLNLDVGEDARSIFLETIQPVLIDGGSDSSYGTAKFYSITISGRKCGLLIGTRGEYSNSKIEIVDTVHLRSALQLRDGDVVTIERV